MTQLSDALEVLGVFLIPFGGGIPAGVLLAKSHGLEWPLTAFLYFVSDVILAIVFEPLFLLFVKHVKGSPRLTQFVETFKASYKDMLAKTGINMAVTPSPLALIVLSFGLDPMSGRAIAHSVGHGFFAGWAIAICGDMIYFALLMASTLWLNSLLGDGTMTAMIIMAAMFLVPMGIKKIRGK